MTRPNVEMRKLLRDLTNLMKEEAGALAGLKFKSLADLAGRKAQFVEAISVRLSERSSTAVDAQLIAEVRSLQALAASNAAQIEMLRGGVARARASLERMASTKHSAGVYGAHGQLLRCGDQGSRSREV